jgi:hypothetical protein
VTSVDVLSRFLRDLGVSPELIPASEQQQIELYRAELADKRILVVLDNAAAPEQVRPLLPETPTCSVLVTSRDSLRALTAAVGAHPVGVDVLPAEDSLHLLGASLGQELLVSQADTMAELSSLCGGLPLALRIAAGNLAGRPGRDVEEFVRALRGADRLTALQVEGDEQTAVRKAFDLSYQTRLWEAESMVALAGVRRLLGHPAETVELCATALRNLKPTKCLLDMQWHALTECALALLDLKRPYDAGRAARKALKLATNTNQPIGRATALHVNGLARWAIDDRTAAQASLDAAAELFTMLDMNRNPDAVALLELSPRGR